LLTKAYFDPEVQPEFPPIDFPFYAQQFAPETG
jgi:hypothetical protein